VGCEEIDHKLRKRLCRRIHIPKIMIGEKEINVERGGLDVGNNDYAVIFFQSKQSKHGPYTAAQGELRERGLNARGMAVRKRRRYFTCVRDQGTAWSRNDTAIREPPNEHVRVVS